MVAVFRPVCLGRVLDHMDVVPLPKLEQWAHVSRLAGQVHRYQRLRPRSHRLRHRFRIDVVRARQAIHEDDGRPCVGDGERRRDVRVRRQDDLIAGTDVQRKERQSERVEAAADPDAVLTTDE
jgi:hypothetical protein